MWKIRKLDEQLFMGAAAKIHEFLDIESLMSPGKLSLSKQLGRPLMGKLIHEAVYIEEVKTLDCEVHGYYVCTNGRRSSYEGDARSAPAIYDARVRCCGWENHNIKAFEMGWRVKYGNLWPYTRDGPHPALQNLVSAHRAFDEAHSHARRPYSSDSDSDSSPRSRKKPRSPTFHRLICSGRVP